MSLNLISNVFSYCNVVSHIPSGPVSLVAKGGASAEEGAEGAETAKVRADSRATPRKKEHFMFARFGSSCVTTLMC